MPYEVTLNTDIKRERVAVATRPAANFPKGVNEYTVRFLDLAQSDKQTGEVCNGKICCSYDINAETFEDFYSTVSPLGVR